MNVFAEIAWGNMVNGGGWAGRVTLYINPEGIDMHNEYVYDQKYLEVYWFERPEE